MLKNKSKIVVLLITILLLVSTCCFATDDTVTTDTTVDANNNTVTTETTHSSETTEDTETAVDTEIYNGDLYLFDNDVLMNRLVDGNVFIFGSNVNITGRVNGSVYVFADNVTVDKDAYIVQTLYVCANKLTLNGAANDLYAACTNIDMSYDSFMIRDLRVLAGNFNFNGGVGRDAIVKANNFNFVTEADKAGVVYGNLTYTSNNELSLTEDLVQGDINYTKLGTSEKSVQEIVIEKLISFAKTLVLTVVVFLLAKWLAPKFIEKASSFIGVKSLLALGIGALACVAVMVLSVILMITYVGMPIAIALVALAVLLMSIAFSVTAICVTNTLTEKLKFKKKYLAYIALLVVTLILWGLQQIPYAGLIIKCIISLVGFGIFVLYFLSKNVKRKTVTEQLKM